MKQAIAGFQITERIPHSNRRSIVFRAFRPTDGLRVVLKLPSSDRPSPGQLQQLRAEHDVLERLSHPNIVKPVGLEAYGNGLALVTEELPGDSMMQWVERQGPLSVREFLRAGIAIAEALEAVHAAGVIHKDLNPSNLVADPGKSVGLIDFGIASLIARESRSARSASALEGTLPFLSPEQTGRMNRSVDYRTDLYSAGATFLYMLTGEPPFRTTDPSELVHRHLAQTPDRVADRRSDVPDVLSEIVARLLRKSADDRYQSAAGLVADLRTCLGMLETDANPTFSLATHDVPLRFQVPEALYGREAEIRETVAAFELEADRPRLLLITGHPGIGKSRLVQELQRPLAGRAGYFASGKFDQFTRDVPFDSLVTAFRGLVRQILSETEDRVTDWRRRLATALGPNGQLIVDVIPEVEALLGPQPPVPELAPSESRNRFTQLFRRFVEVFAQPEHPVVMFLDDLQWVDSATLTWLEGALFDADLSSLFLVGAYRDTEVDPAHPLAQTLGRAEDRGALVTRIELGPLGPDDVTRLVADALHADLDLAAPLAGLVTQKTNGNPFFIGQMLESLERNGAIHADTRAGCWRVDLDRVASAKVSDNVIDLLITRIRELSTRAVELLQIAACIGATFQLDTLARIADRNPEHVAKTLFEALEAGLISQDAQWAEAESVEYRFLHDRVQQAAHAMLEEEAAERTHLQIGQLQLEACEDPETDPNLFGMLRHLTLAGDLVSPQTRERLGTLHLAAAVRARRSTAYGPAGVHAATAAELAPPGTWDAPDALGFQIALERAKCAHLLGEAAEAEAFYDQALGLAGDDFDRGVVQECRVHFFTDNARFEDALGAGVEGASLFGIEMVRKFVPPLFATDFLRMKLASWGRSTADLVALPSMTDERALFGARLASVSLKAAYQVQPELAVANANRLVRVCLQKGTYPESPLAYLVMGPIFQGGVMGQHSLGYDWGRLALELIDRFDNRALASETTFVNAYFANSWRAPLSDSEARFREAYRLGVEVGDLFHASCACSGIAQTMLMRGEHLGAVEAECDRLLPFLQGIDAKENLGTVLSVRQTARNLTGRTTGTASFSDADFDEDAFVATLPDFGSKHFAHCYFVDKLQALLLWGHLDEARALLEVAKPYLPASVGLQHAVEHRFLEGLLFADLLASGANGPHRSWRKALGSAAKKLAKWSAELPGSYAHKAWLLEAEVHRVNGRHELAAGLYERSIEAATKGGFQQNRAVARERAGRNLLAAGRREGARLHLREAAYDYERWGAPALGERVLKEELGSVHSRLLSVSGSHDSSSHTDSNPTVQLDLAALMRSAQAISGEIHLEGLLTRLLTLLIENAGAERGVLVLPDESGGRVEAEGDGDGIRVLSGRPLEAYTELPQAVMRYVMRTREPLVLEDATRDPRFAHDPYLADQKMRSVLVVPFLDKRTLRGVVYLENSLTAGAFSPDRVELITLLTGQIAISIDKAILYDRLEEKVRERTEQLQRRNEFIRQVFGRYLSDDIVDSLLETPKGLKLGGERREVTILMTDLRGFTPLTESLQPEQVVGVINNYLSRMTEVILEYGGTIDEFIGDAILVIFGAPFRREDDADRAVACALAMQLALAEVNAENVLQGLPTVEMGVGIATGEVVVGNIGSERRAKYGVVGRSVNLAARVESLTVGGQVLVADSTLRRMAAEVTTASQIEIQAKGIQIPVTVHDITAIGAPFDIQLDAERASVQELTEALELRLNALVGKMGNNEWVEGRFTALSETEAVLDTAAALEPLTNLRIRLTESDEDLYAKVLLPRDDEVVRVRFTSVPESARARFDQALPDQRG